MGLFGDTGNFKSYGGRINELKTKIEQLEAVGMLSSANRLKRELAKIDKNIPEKIKPLSVSALKKQVSEAKALGRGKI